MMGSLFLLLINSRVSQFKQKRQLGKVKQERWRPKCQGMQPKSNASLLSQRRRKLFLTSLWLVRSRDLGHDATLQSPSNRLVSGNVKGWSSKNENGEHRKSLKGNFRLPHVTSGTSTGPYLFVTNK